MPDSMSEIARRIAQYPTSARPYFKSGFSLAASLSEQARVQIMDALIENFRSGRRQLGVSDLTPLTGLNNSQSEQIAGVYSLLIGLLGESDASPQDFVSEGRDILFNPDDEAAVLAIAADICSRREQINATVERAQMAGAVLPSLSGVTLAVDLRVKMQDGKVRVAVPVAVAHIETDVTGQNLWLQLSQGDIEDLIKTLSSTAEEMKSAAKIVGGEG